ncbi:RES family NAD+ phosphorylase [Luteimonas kalidii]|uniref:RES family NAD+ phosphorylase n=1 Tax=Luteimonas kalidii TaxID=3042025 RepID=A0ABT6JWA8_9GAMM|nr:RES family NAD+ phosphorylase [Luteimonas kalidii]MDH5834231.1 RES family NAD+ phosphorylase [Luteimonas kalidii]
MNLDACDSVIEDVLQSSTEGEFCYRIRPLLDFYDVLSVVFGRGETIFWRARATNEGRFANLEQLDYPPAQFARVGRLNDHGVPAFYAANSIHTALCEIEARDGQLVQVAGFRLVSGATLGLILVGEYANVQQSGYVHTLGTDPGGTIKRLIREHGRGAHAQIYIDKFLSSVVNDPLARESNYTFSRALGAMLHRSVSAHGISFPSVRDPGGINIAVHPEPSDLAFENVACALVRVGKRRRFGMLDHEVITASIGLDHDLNFVWPATSQPGRICIYNVTPAEYAAILADNPDPGAIAKALPYQGG